MANLDALLADGNDLRLVEAIFESLNDQLRDGDPRTLPEAHATLLVPWGAASLIDNGGWDYYFSSSCAEGVELVLALERIGASDALAEARDVMLVFPDSRPPSDFEERWSVWSRIGKKKRDSLCKGNLYSAALLPFVADYVRAHAREFADVDVSDTKIDEWLPPPVRTPDASAPDEDVLAWLQRRVYSMEFHGLDEIYFARDPLPRPPAVLSAITFDGTRRDDDDTLARLCAWQGANKLVEVMLERSRVSAAGLAQLARLPRLERVSLQGTRCSNDDFLVLADCPSLREVNLSWTQVNDEALQMFARRKRLHALNASNTSISDDGLMAMPELRGLELGDNPNISPDLRFLERLTAIETLFVRTRCDERGFVRIAKLPKLVDLTFWQDEFPGEWLVHLDGHASLRRLHVDGYLIDEKLAKHLETIPNLEWIMEDSLTTAAREYLEIRHPEWEWD